MNQEYYDNPGYYNETPSTGTSLASSTSGFSIEPIKINQFEGRSAKQMTHRAELAAVQENHKAQLTQQVIINTTALSGIADQAVAAVPSCERPVRNIVNVYALSSSAKIATRW